MLPTVAHLDTGLVDPDRVAAAARRAEAPAGFDGVYVGDHLLHRHPILEPIVTLSAFAAVTRRITIGTCVLLAGLRQPLVLAKQLTMLETINSDFVPSPGFLINDDPPVHGGHRSVLARVFTPRRVNQLEPQIRAYRQAARRPPRPTSCAR